MPLLRQNQRWDQMGYKETQLAELLASRCSPCMHPLFCLLLRNLFQPYSDHPDPLLGFYNKTLQYELLRVGPSGTCSGSKGHSRAST